MVFNATLTIFQLHRGGNQKTQRKPQTCRKSLTNFITFIFKICSNFYNHPEENANYNVKMFFFTI